MPTLTSAAHPLIALAAACHERKGREAHGLLLVEGRRALDAVMAAGWQPAHLFHPADAPPPPTWSAGRAQAVDGRARARLSAQRTASGWAGLFPLPASPPRPGGGMVLVGVHDPGNVGTLIRAADAFAWPQVVLVGGADPWAPKAVQASAGAIAALPVARVDAGIAPSALIDAPAAALVVRGGRPPEGLRCPWLVVGGEADGLDAAWRAACTEAVTLPMPGGTESLNAAMAGAIAAYVLGDAGAARSPGRGAGAR